jgi:hypothetical protein
MLRYPHPFLYGFILYNILISLFQLDCLVVFHTTQIYSMLILFLVYEQVNYACNFEVCVLLQSMLLCLGILQ